MSFFSTFVQIVLKTNKNVSILWCVSKLWTKEKLWKRREVYHESKKGITFVLILTLIIVGQFSGTVRAGQEYTKCYNLQRELNVADNKKIAKKIGEKINYSKKEKGVSMNYSDAFLEKQNNSEIHESVQDISVDVDENINENKEGKSLLSKFGINIVYANEEASMSKRKSDSSGSIVIKMVLKYTIYNRAKGDFIKIKKLTSSMSFCNGRKVSPGSGVSVVSNELAAGETGFYSGGYQSAYKEYNLPKTPYSKVVKLPEKWRAVAVDSAEVGATQFVTLKRGKGKWKVSLQCNPVLAAY